MVTYAYSFEPLRDGSILRRHPNGRFGYDYDFLAVVDRWGDTAYIKGVNELPSDFRLKQLVRYLQGQGFKRAFWIHQDGRIMIFPARQPRTSTDPA